MATLTNASAHWGETSLTRSNNTTVLNKLMNWADAQAPNKTVWFIVSLIAQGVLFLPVPAVLMYYFDAPLFVLAITMTLFFSNIIAGMGGAGIRVLISFFAFSVLVHVLMLLIFSL